MPSIRLSGQSARRILQLAPIGDIRIRSEPEKKSHLIKGQSAEHALSKLVNMEGAFGSSFHHEGQVEIRRELVLLSTTRRQSFTQTFNVCGSDHSRLNSRKMRSCKKKVYPFTRSGKNET
jgi:hypothetical protein